MKKQFIEYFEFGEALITFLEFTIITHFFRGVYKNHVERAYAEIAPYAVESQNIGSTDLS